MGNFLKTRHTHPIEREYEAWIVQGIERYFTDLGMEFAIWAVSPDVEATWPADESLFSCCKVVGLQFKKAKLGPGSLEFDRLNWSLHKPIGQYEAVQDTSEIFYCLPTFVDRSVRSHALEHCLFWRPDSALDYNAWYDNPSARTPHNRVRDAMRWGHFVETLVSCEIGAKASSLDEARGHVDRMYQRVRELAARKEAVLRASAEDTGLHVLIVAI